MNWKVKLLVQKLVHVLPNDLGLRLHSVMQQRFGTIGRMNSDRRNAILKRRIDIARYLQGKVDHDFEGCKILEVGSGWHGSDILLFYMLGSSEIYTCDVFRHLSEPLVIEMLQTIGENLDIISQECDIDIVLLEARYIRMRSCEKLHDILALANIKYLAPVEFHKVDFPTSYFDLFYSHSVLQRVPPEDLNSYLKTARRALKSSGYSYHIIHHSDHNARHDDKLGALDYLRYSDHVYNIFQTEKFNYQNRMRHSEFLQLFTASAFENIAEETVAMDCESAGRLRLSPRFEFLPLDDILITRTQMISRPI